MVYFPCSRSKAHKTGQSNAWSRETRWVGCCSYASLYKCQSLPACLFRVLSFSLFIHHRSVPRSSIAIRLFFLD